MLSIIIASRSDVLLNLMILRGLSTHCGKKQPAGRGHSCFMMDLNGAIVAGAVFSCVYRLSVVDISCRILPAILRQGGV